MLEVKDLTRVYGRGEGAHVAIEGVEFQVAEGELVSIVGPSGCGKSTLLRCVAGLLTPTGGPGRAARRAGGATSRTGSAWSSRSTAARSTRG